jgi:SLT domain-containing protein
VAQVIPPTFAAHHVAGTSAAIYHPVANIAAASRYIRDTYHVSLDGSDFAAKVQQADPNRPPKGY